MNVVKYKAMKAEYKREMIANLKELLLQELLVEDTKYKWNYKKMLKI